jgi:hypothetical protein
MSSSQGFSGAAQQGSRAITAVAGTSRQAADSTMVAASLFCGLPQDFVLQSLPTLQEVVAGKHGQLDYQVDADMKVVRVPAANGNYHRLESELAAPILAALRHDREAGRLIGQVVMPVRLLHAVVENKTVCTLTHVGKFVGTAYHMHRHV